MKIMTAIAMCMAAAVLAACVSGSSGNRSMAPPSVPTRADLPTMGYALYDGTAAATYRIKFGNDVGNLLPQLVGQVTDGRFTADARIVADFEKQRVDGCIGCAKGIVLDDTPQRDLAARVLFDRGGGVGHVATVIRAGAPLADDGTFEHSVRTDKYFEEWSGKLTRTQATGKFSGSGVTGGGTEASYDGTFSAEAR